MKPAGLLAIGLAVLLSAGCGSHGDGHLVSGARDGLSRAELDVQSGAASITVETAPLGDDLYRVATPHGAGVKPSVQQDGRRVQVFLTGPGSGVSAVTIELSSDVAWSLRFDGGATDLVADLHTGKVSSVDLVAGDAHAALDLPGPAGTVRVAGNAPVRTTIGGGAASVEVDGVAHTGVAGGTVFAPPRWAAVGDRYDLVARGGVSALTVGRL